MKTALFTALLLGTSGCGAMFNDATDVPIAVSVPAAAEFSVDDVPVGHAENHTLYVDAHHDHVITARVGDEVIGTCRVHAKVQKRYIAGDIILVELIVPVVLDAVTNDWAVVEPTTCVFR